jgi:hypothetical protein
VKKYYPKHNVAVEVALWQILMGTACIRSDLILNITKEG